MNVGVGKDTRHSSNNISRGMLKFYKWVEVGFLTGDSEVLVMVSGSEYRDGIT